MKAWIFVWLFLSAIIITGLILLVDERPLPWSFLLWTVPLMTAGVMILFSDKPINCFLDIIGPYIQKIEPHIAKPFKWLGKKLDKLGQ